MLPGAEPRGGAWRHLERARPAHRGRGRGPRAPAGADGRGHRGARRHALRPRRAGPPGRVDDRPGRVPPRRPTTPAPRWTSPVPAAPGCRPWAAPGSRSGTSSPPGTTRAFPGHHLQLAQWAYVAPQLSRYQSAVGSVSANAEGWALYAERLMDELGFLHGPGSAARLPGRAADAGGPGDHRHRHAPRAADPGGPGVAEPFRPGERWTPELAREFFGAQQRPTRRVPGQRAHPLPRLAGPGHRLQARRARLARGPGGRASRPRRRLRRQGLAHGGPVPGLARASTTWSPSWPPSSDLPCGPSWWRPSGTSRSCGTCPTRRARRTARWCGSRRPGCAAATGTSWPGHDPDIALPHVPGHEFAGVVAEVGADVRRVAAGRARDGAVRQRLRPLPPLPRGRPPGVRATSASPASPTGGRSPSSSSCERAEVNLVRLPPDGRRGRRRSAGLPVRDGLPGRRARSAASRRGSGWPCTAAAAWGCRRSMVAVAAGARVVAVDVRRRALDLATSGGAEAASWPAGGRTPAVAARGPGRAGGGAPCPSTRSAARRPARRRWRASRRRGRHVQVGLLPRHARLARGADGPGHRRRARDARQPRDGGAGGTRELLGLVAAGRLRPGDLVTSRIGLAAAGPALAAMGSAPPTGITGGGPVTTPLLPTDPPAVGPYRVTARLGAGGIGRVLPGARARAGRRRVKVIRPEYADDPDYRPQVRTARRPPPPG